MKSHSPEEADLSSGADAGVPSRTEPYERVLEFTRAWKAEDPYGFHFEKQDYRLRTEGGAIRSAHFPWNDRLLADLQSLADEIPDAEAARRLGEQLRHFLDKLGWGGHENAFERFSGEGGALRLVLRSAAAELYALPWELMTRKGPGLHLAELPGCTLRYEWPREHGSPPRPSAPQGSRVLFAWSTAGGLVPAEEHLRAIQQSCREGDLPFDARRDVLSRVSLRSLEERLKNSREPVSVLHVLCHGAPLPSRSSRLYGLAWNSSGDEGGTQVVDAGALAAILAPYTNTLRMVVLCACQGGDSGQMASHLGSVAQALHRADIEMVLASRLPLSSRGSVLLAETLYRKLLVESCSLEEALSAARRELRVAGTGFDWASLQLYARREAEADLRPMPLRPYRGLLAFEPHHRRFFFGRSKLEAMLLERVLQAASGQRPRFQVVAGASGTGKSSVVMAGLVPQLPAEGWDWLIVRPGELARAGAHSQAERSSVLQELRHRLRRLESSATPPAGGGASQAELLEEMRRLRTARPGRRLLLVVDQLEEAFTQLGGEDRQALLRGLWALSREAPLQCVVVATLRVDHFERCGEVALDEQTRLDGVVYSGEHRIFVTQLGAEELAEVIEQPAHKVGLELEPGLVDRLCKDVGQEPGALPLLEHALDLLWQKREGRQLKHQTYEELGGVVGALTQTAERLYQEFAVSERHQARRLLVRLVAVQEMGSSQARGRVWVEELQPQEEAEREAFAAVLEKLVEHRLLVKGGAEQGDGGEAQGSWVQLAHETLLRRWKRLEQWVEEDWEREQQLRELERWAEEWESHLDSEDRGASYLLAGDRLGYAKSLREKIGGELSPRSRRFIEESQGTEERIQQEERARQENEKAMMLALSEARARAARFLGRGLLVTAVLLVLAIVAAVIFADLRQQEQAQRRIAQDTTRLLWAEHVQQRDPTKALLILREVISPEKPQRWMETTVNILQQPVARAVLRTREIMFRAADFSADGKQVVTTTPKAVQVWSLDGTLLSEWHGDNTRDLDAFNVDRQLLVTRSTANPRTVQVWNTAGKQLASLAHDSEVERVTVSPDGQRIVTCSTAPGLYSQAWLWSVDGRLLTTVRGSPHKIQAVFSPDSTRLAITLTEWEVQVLDANGGMLATIENREGPVDWLVFSPNGQHLLMVSGRTKVQLWNMKGERLAQLQGHSILVPMAAFSPDGQYVVTASWDKTARVWKADGTEIARLGHDSVVATAAFSPDGQRIVTASWDRTARVWSTQGRPLARLLGHGDSLASAAFSPDGKHVLTNSGDRTVRVWSVEDSLSEKLEGHSATVNQASFSPDGTRVLTASWDQTARVWSRDGKELARLKGHSGRVLSAHFSPDGKQVTTADEDGDVARVWDIEGELLVTLPGRSADFSPDSKRLVTVLRDGTAQIWSAERTLLTHLKAHEGDDAGIVSAGFSPDGTGVLTVSTDNTARVWNTNGTLLAILQGHDDRITSAGFSPDGKRVLTASSDKTARIWSADGKVLATLDGHTGPVRSAAFSPDGMRVVTASADGTARVWSTDGALLAILKGHLSEVYSAAFSPDGQRVVTDAQDRTARVWSAEGRLLATLKSTDLVYSAAFSPDGKYVVTAPGDRTARVWPLDVELVMERLEKATSECLEVEERQLYLDESPKEARSQYEHCQRAHGRAPAAP